MNWVRVKWVNGLGFLLALDPIRERKWERTREMQQVAGTVATTGCTIVCSNRLAGGGDLAGRPTRRERRVESERERKEEKEKR